MSREDEYRRNADEAQKHADAAKTDTDRAGWLRVAQGWLSLIRNRPKSDLERFEDAADQRGTKQERSGSSH